MKPEDITIGMKVIVNSPAQYLGDYEGEVLTMPRTMQLLPPIIGVGTQIPKPYTCHWVLISGFGEPVDISSLKHKKQTK